jgi:drug/metabolite transporter (DMT)-like permease
MYACLLGAIVLGDPIHMYHLMGFVLIVAGLAIAAASRQKA